MSDLTVPPTNQETVPAAAATASASYSHRRRMSKPTQEDKKATHWSNSAYLHSTDSRSKPLKQHLLAVHGGILAVCTEFNIQCDPADLEWLITHQGRFQRYIHQDSPYYKYMVQQKKYANKPLQEVQAAVLERNHFILGVASPRFLGRTYTPVYKDSLEVNLLRFWNFLAIIGDYQSMLLLLPHPPPECPSIKHSSLQAFVLHTFRFPNKPLYYHWDSTEESHRVKDRNGVPMITQGGRMCPTSFFNIFSGLSILHGKYARMKNSMYCTQCQRCLALFKTALNSHQNPGTPHFAVGADPCPTHVGTGPNRYLPMGNPTGTDEHKQLISYVNKTQSARNYIATSAAPLLPCDMLKIHSHMTYRQFDLSLLARYTNILGAIHTAARFDEYSDVKCGDFNNVHHLFEFRNNKVVSIAQEVLGKPDNKWYTYRIAFADSVPKLCYLRHLLVYVHCMNLSPQDDSYLYPHPELFIDGIDTSTPTYIQENGKYKEMVYWMNRVTGYQDDHIRPHSTRSTFYLWWILAGGDVPTAQRNARHATESMAHKYAQDSYIQRDVIMKDEYLRSQNPVPPAYDRLLVNGGHQLHRINQLGRSTRSDIKTLTEVAHLYVTQTLCVSPTSGHFRNPSYLLKKSYMTSSAAANNPYDKLRSIVDTLDNETKPIMQKALDEFIAGMEHFWWQRFSRQYPRLGPLGHLPPNRQGSFVASPCPPPVNQLRVLQKPTNYSKYIFPSNTSHLKTPKEMFQYMFHIVLDIVSLNPSTDVSLKDKFEEGRKKVDVTKTNPTLKGWWTKRGMNDFGGCITAHYNLDFDRFWNEKAEVVSRKTPYRCSQCGKRKSGGAPSASLQVEGGEMSVPEGSTAAHTDEESAPV